MQTAQGKISRKEWRKIVKKKRRKVRRQKQAVERDCIEAEEENRKQACPEYQLYLAEKEQQDQIALDREKLERKLRNAIWLEDELEAQLKFQQVHAAERKERETKERIRKEFEERERKVAEAKAERLKQQEEVWRLMRERHVKLQEFAATGVDDYLDELQQVYNTRADAEDCNFFLKTGACRHGLRCIRNHATPGLSRIMFIPNFYANPALEQTVHAEYGQDGRLEFDEEDLKHNFSDFFRDIIAEFELFGKLQHIFVCRNYVPHLKGSVYMEYETIRSAAAAYLRMNGRFYAKRQLHVEFRNPIVWPMAVCDVVAFNNGHQCRINFPGQFELKRCHKGSSCNFLHIFKNPDHRYLYNHFQESRSIRHDNTVVPATPLIKKSWDEITSSSARSTRPATQWRWSESPEMEPKESTSVENHSSRGRKENINEKRSSRRGSRSSTRIKPRSPSPRRSAGENRDRNRHKRSRSRDSNHSRENNGRRKKHVTDQHSGRRREKDMKKPKPNDERKRGSRERVHKKRPEKRKSQS